MLKIEHLKKSFEGKTILDDISLSVESGEIVSIIGPSLVFSKCFIAIEKNAKRHMGLVA